MTTFGGDIPNLVGRGATSTPGAAARPPWSTPRRGASTTPGGQRQPVAGARTGAGIATLNPIPKWRRDIDLDRPARHHRCWQAGIGSPATSTWRRCRWSTRRHIRPRAGPAHSAGGFSNTGCVDLRQRRGEFRDPGGGGASVASSRPPRGSVPSVITVQVLGSATSAWSLRATAPVVRRATTRTAPCRCSARSPRRTGAQPIDR